MKKIYILFVFVFIAKIGFAQNVGIGTTTPTEKLHIDSGKVRINTLGNGTSFQAVFADPNGVLSTGPKIYPQIKTSGPLSLNIPDNNCVTGVSDTIIVSGQPSSFNTNQISVSLNITTTFDADIRAFLIAPNGDILTLLENNGLSGDNFSNTILADTGNTIIPNSSIGAPWTAVYKPGGFPNTTCGLTGTIATFGAIGGGTINPNGNWVLRVFDDETSDASTLQNWAINFGAPLSALAIDITSDNNKVAKFLNGDIVTSSIYDNGNVGIGTNTPNAPLQFASTITNRKIVLFESYNNENQYYGLGINGSTLRYQVDATGSDHVFFAGVNDSTSNELFRIKGNGQVKISGGNPGLNKVLTSDATGLASWETPTQYWQATGNDISNTNTNNVGIGTATPNAYGHGGNNKILEVKNTNISPNSQSQIMLSTGAADGSIGGITWAQHNIVTEKRAGFIGCVLDPFNTGSKLAFYTRSNAPSNTLSERMTINGLGVLCFPNVTGQKISFWDNGTNNYGIGLQGGLLQIHSGVSTDDIAFGYGSSTSFTENMRVKGNGNVGIGTTNPTYKLHIGNTTAGLRIEGPATAGGTALSVGGLGDVLIDKPGTLGGRFTIKENGKIGIGKNTPLSTLDILAGNNWDLINGEGDFSIGNNNFRLKFGIATAGGGAGAAGIRATDGVQQLQLAAGTSSGLILFGTGNATLAGSLTQFSDRRLKTNIEPLQSSLNKISKLNGYTYNWISNDKDPRLQIGFIAQEVQAEFPQLVTELKLEGQETLLGVNYEGMIPVLLEAIKEQQQQIEELKSQIKILQSK